MFQVSKYVPGLNSRAWTASLWTIKQRRLWSMRTHTHSVSLRNHQPCNSNSRSSCGILHTVTLPVNTHGEDKRSLCLYTQIIPRHLELGMKLTQVSPSIVPDATLETSSSRSIHFTSLSWSSSHCASEKGGCEYTRLFPPLEV